MTADRFIPEIVETTIASSGSTSAAVNLSGLQLVAIKTPSALTGSSFTFTACDTVGGTYVLVQAVDGGSDYTASAATSEAQWIPVDVRVFAGVPFLKLVSSGTEAADRTIQLICRPVS